MLVRTVYKVRQAVYESAQVFTHKHRKRSFTLSISGAESTVALLSLDQQHIANHWGAALSVMWVVRHGRSRQVQVRQKLSLTTGGNLWKIITGNDWQAGTLKTPSEYCRRAFYAHSRHFPSTFWIPQKNENYRGVHDALRRCTFIHYLHMLIVPFRYLLWTLLVPKFATGYNPDYTLIFFFNLIWGKHINAHAQKIKKILSSKTTCT